MLLAGQSGSSPVALAYAPALQEAMILWPMNADQQNKILEMIGLLDGKELEFSDLSPKESDLSELWNDAHWDLYKLILHDLPYRQHVDPILESVLQTFLRERKSHGTPLVVDLFGGDGSLIQRLNSAFPKQATYALIDRNTTLINDAKTRIGKRPNVTIFQKDIRQIDDLAAF